MEKMLPATCATFSQPYTRHAAKSQSIPILAFDSAAIVGANVWARSRNLLSIHEKMQVVSTQVVSCPCGLVEAQRKKTVCQGHQVVLPA